ncbi:MAG: pseudouridine synthase [Candidatus Hydrogenedentes bacterium]|nr:pseudouridine synthase [Candidatus Hydrogenedentota bacterium]
MSVKLQKFLASCSIASRRECERLIVEGRVSVNGAVATLGDRIEADNDTVTLDGNALSRDRHVYVVLNKPKGVITSVKDTHDRETVLDLITGVDARIFPIGRLDMDVTGTLLLTNDGELTHQLSHPSFEIDKVYMAWVSGHVRAASLQQLQEGVLLEDGMTAPARAKIVKRGQNSTLIRLTIHEGRKRLVKRMCAAVKHRVYDLRRIRIGTIQSDDLMPGEWRHLSNEEVESLKRLANPPS